MHLSICIYRTAKERIRRFLHLCPNRKDTEPKTTRCSIEDSVTQENTTETFDNGIDGALNEATIDYRNSNELTVEIPLKKKVHRTNRNRKTMNITDPNRRSLASSSATSSPTSITVPVPVNRYRRTTAHSVGATTSSTNVAYRSDIGNNLKRNSLNSQYGMLDDNLHHQISNNISDEQMLRRESSSTYECDMDIIDLLQRDRSMDLQRESCNAAKASVSRRSIGIHSSHDSIRRPKRETHRSNDVMNHTKRCSSIPKTSSSERRKLPDISRIIAPNSTKSLLHNLPPNFPNYVFTHQQQHLPHYYADDHLKDGTCKNTYTPKDL